MSDTCGKAITIANDARTSSIIANQKIDAHERSCLLKHTQIIDTQKEIKDNVKGLHGILWKGALGLISALFLVAWALLKTKL